MRRSSRCSTRSPPRTQGSFGVNFLLPFLDPEAVDLAASRARLVEFFYGDPDSELVGRVHAAGALAAWQIGSVGRSACGGRGRLRRRRRAGHGGRRPCAGRARVVSLLEQVLGTVAVPVVAAGGNRDRANHGCCPCRRRRCRPGWHEVRRRPRVWCASGLRRGARPCGRRGHRADRGVRARLAGRPASRSPELPGSGRGGGRGHIRRPRRGRRGSPDARDGTRRRPRRTCAAGSRRWPCTPAWAWRRCSECNRRPRSSPSSSRKRRRSSHASPDAAARAA